MAFPPTKSKTYVTGETLTASDLNTSLSDAVNSNIPEDTDDYSVNDTEMQTTTDPYPAAATSRPTTLAGEIERLRYLIAQITGEAQWYIDPDGTLAAVFTNSATFAGAKTFSSAVTINPTTNQLVLGVTNTTTISATAPSASRVYTLPDAGAAANFALITDPTAATSELAINNTAADGDPVLSWELSGTNVFTLGVDDSDSDKLKLGTTAITTSNMLSVTTTGEINQPLQPSFLAYVNSSITNVTGDNTTYTVIFDTEVFDQGADFNLGTSTFTAPVDGKYLVTCAIGMGQVATSTHTACNLDIVTSNRTYRHRMTAVPALVVNWPSNFSALVDLDVNDTFTIQVTVDGGSKVVDVSGGTPFQSHVSCSLIN